jgi:hypothetical protein
MNMHNMEQQLMGNKSQVHQTKALPARSTRAPKPTPVKKTYKHRGRPVSNNQVVSGPDVVQDQVPAATAAPASAACPTDADAEFIVVPLHSRSRSRSPKRAEVAAQEPAIASADNSLEALADAASSDDVERTTRNGAQRIITQSYVMVPSALHDVLSKKGQDYVAARASLLDALKDRPSSPQSASVLAWFQREEVRSDHPHCNEGTRARSCLICLRIAELIPKLPKPTEPIRKVFQFTNLQ